MKSNSNNIIIKIIFGLILVVSLFLIISGLTTKDNNSNSNEIIETGLLVNPSNIRLTVGEEQLITTTIVPENATYKNLNWEIGNPSIISLNDNTVRGLNPGTTYIKVTTEKQKIMRLINVTVVENIIPVTEIKPKVSNIEMDVGDTKEIEYEVIPSDATNKRVSYTVDNKDVIGFNTEGKIVGISKGTAIITLKSNNVLATINVTVKEKEIPVTSISLDKTKLNLIIGKESQLKISFVPKNATNKTITWKSDNEKVATVKAGKVKGISKGTAKITAKTSNGKIVTCAVTVEEEIKEDRIHFIKQSIKATDASDAILLESNGHFAMVDTGKSTDKDNQFIYNYLKKVGVKELEFILITHNHDDHNGGAVYLLNSDIKVKHFYIKTYLGRDNERSYGIKMYKNLIDAVNKNKVPITYIDKEFKDGTGFTFYDMDIKLYNTEQQMNKKEFVGGSENYNSVMELITVNNKKIFLAADCYSGGIMEKVSKTIGKVDIMKLPHHGYSTCSMNKERANRLSPKYIIVTNFKINACRKYFNSNIPTYYVKSSKKDAIVIELNNSIKIID